MYEISIKAESRDYAIRALKEAIETFKDKDYEFAYELSGDTGYDLEIVSNDNKKKKSKCR